MITDTYKSRYGNLFQRRSPGNKTLKHTHDPKHKFSQSISPLPVHNLLHLVVLLLLTVAL